MRNEATPNADGSRGRLVAASLVNLPHAGAEYRAAHVPVLAISQAEAAEPGPGRRRSDQAAFARSASSPVRKLK